MADVENKYRVLIYGQLDTSGLKGDVAAYNEKKELTLRIGIDDKTARQALEKTLADLEALGNKISKVRISEGIDKSGNSGIRGATIEYVNTLGQAERKWVEINEQITKSTTRTIDLREKGVAPTLSFTERLTKSFTSAISQTVQYALSIGALYAAFNQLQQGIQHVIDLNKELVSIQVIQAEGAQTPEEIAQLSKEYNDLAKELGATTQEIASGSLEWL